MSPPLPLTRHTCLFYMPTFIEKLYKQQTHIANIGNCTN